VPSFDQSLAKLPHPALWRASQISHPDRPCLPTGHASLSAELPGRGWPRGSLIELLAPHAGVGELSLLQPALAALPDNRPIVLVQPPHMPNLSCWAAWQMNPAQLLWLRPRNMNDALWAANQVLKHGSGAALLCWLPTVRPEALRRLHGAAQATDTLFVVIRPLHAAREPSPAPLRLVLQPARDGLLLRFLKRRGPPRDLPLHLALQRPPALPGVDAPIRHHPLPGSGQPDTAARHWPIPSSLPLSHASMDRHTFSSAQPERTAPPMGG
jgi:protein ImuA